MLIVMYATDDSYLPYFVATILGVLGNYLIFLAFSDTRALHYPKDVAYNTVCYLFNYSNCTYHEGMRKQFESFRKWQ